MSRHPPDSDRITIARLHGRACHHVANNTAHDDAVADLIDVATERRRGRQPALRVDLLSQVAGQHLGAHQTDPVLAWLGERAWRLLVAAGGTDEHLTELAAAEARSRTGRKE